MVAVFPAESVVSHSSTRHAMLVATWLSSSFPVGAFSYSHGLESAISSGQIVDEPSTEAWCSALLRNGSGWCDAVVLAEAWNAVSDDDLDRLEAASELAIAMAPSAERLLETQGLGEAFIEAVSAGWPHSLLDRFKSGDFKRPYPVAVGTAAAAHGVPLEITLAGFLNSFIANLISVAVRLIPLGQTTGLRVQSRLHPLVLETASRTASSSLDDLGSIAMLADIAAMRHETLHSRVFRS